MRGSIIKTKRREGIALDDAILQTDFADLFLRPVREADLPPGHHLDDQALDSEGEAIRFE